MKKIKLKRFVITVVIMLACYLLQCTLFPSLELASVKPNRYSVWNGAGAVCTDLSDDRLCEWPVQ